jgi:hypothetical protein
MQDVVICFFELHGNSTEKLTSGLKPIHADECCAIKDFRHGNFQYADIKSTGSQRTGK